jgi:CheY-like chemotaxis protein
VARIGDGNNATGDWLEVRVTDTGVGIRAEDLPRLFQDFVQLEATATKRHEGTGLGLALTKQLVELHGGRIWAESEGAGCGATFVVQLPFLEVPAPRILVVDDEAPFRRLLAMILGGAGYRVQVAEDAAEAVRAVEADPPALVVLDVGLPPDGAGGWTVLARLRSTPDLCAVPVLIVTGQDQIRAEEALARGATDFLGKPVSADVLEQTVERLLARAARLGDATGSGPPLRA